MRKKISVVIFAIGLVKQQVFFLINDTPSCYRLVLKKFNWINNRRNNVNIGTHTLHTLGNFNLTMSLILYGPTILKNFTRKIKDWNIWSLSVTVFVILLCAGIFYHNFNYIKICFSFYLNRWFQYFLYYFSCTSHYFIQNLYTHSHKSYWIRQIFCDYYRMTFYWFWLYSGYNSRYV